MFVYGYAVDYYYTGDGSIMVKVRIPNIHGPWKRTDSNGKKRYVEDENLPYYPGLVMPHRPNPGDVVLLSSTNNTMNNLVVLGLTGASYLAGATDLE